MIKFFIVVFFISILSSISISAQDSSKHALSFSGYIDVYAAYYSDSAGIGNYQKYPSVSPRSKQAGLNVIMFTAKYNTDKLRATATLHYGDVPLSVWSGKYNFIQEANAGVLLCKDVWIDAGFFRTHFGTEALFPRENYTSSVSVPTFFEPYYEAGVRLNYMATKKLTFYIYALNGYGMFDDNNEKKSGALLATYEFSDKLNIGYSGYYGDDSLHGHHLRMAHNAFINFKGKKLKITIGGDYVSQKHSAISDPGKAAFMGSGVFIASYNFTKKTRIYGRAEGITDPDGVLTGIFTDTNNKSTGLKLWGVTAGVECKPTADSYIRLEGRSLSAGDRQEIFHHDGKDTNQRFEAMINFGISF